MADDSKEIGKIGIDETGSSNVKEPILIKLSSFKNFKFIDIRKYYEENGEWKPTKKGIAMNKSQLDDFFRIYDKNKQEIDTWFSKEE